MFNEYERKNKTVQAIQLTRENGFNVFLYLLNTERFTGLKYSVQDGIFLEPLFGRLGRKLIAFGSYIVEKPDGEIEHVSKIDFEDEFYLKTSEETIKESSLIPTQRLLLQYSKEDFAAPLPAKSNLF